MSTYPTKLVEAFASQALRIFYMRSVSQAITNQDYEGQVKDKSSILNVLTFGAISSKTYTGADLTADSLSESNCQLVTDQLKAFYFKIKDYDTFRSYIKSPDGTILDQVSNELKKVVDTFVLALYGDVASGQRDGTDYTTGTVTITVTTGAVLGSGTTFVTGMVGKGFKALGHTAWYRVKTYTSTTAIVIEDDSDDDTSAYTGGAIAGGATYTVQANTKLAVTKDTIFARCTELQRILTDAEIPDESRWLVIPARIGALVRQAPEYISAGTESGRENVMNGILSKRFAGFDLYEVSEARIGGDNTDGYHCMGGHKSGITFAMGMTENGIEDLIGNFGKAYKSLHVYGAKVADERRKALVEGFWYVA